MKSQYKGHCQGCARLQAVLPNGLIAKHGYKVKYGFFMGVCNGAGHAPLEVSEQYTLSVIESITQQIDELLAQAQSYRDGTAQPEVIRVGNSRNERIIPFAEAQRWEVSRFFFDETGRLETRAYYGQRTIEALSQARAEFHGKDLIPAK
jgi:hypothetical protein